MPKGITEPPTEKIQSSVVGPLVELPEEEERLDLNDLLQKVAEMIEARFADLQPDVYEILEEWIHNENILNEARTFIRITSPQIHLAYVKDTPAGVTEVNCYLDTDAAGEEIVVYCKIADGSGGTTKLNAAVPRLTDGDELKVVKIGDYWRCIDKFVALDTDHFQITDGKLQDKLSSC